MIESEVNLGAYGSNYLILKSLSLVGMSLRASRIPDLKSSGKVVETKDRFGILLKSREPEQLGAGVLHGTLHKDDDLQES